MKYLREIRKTLKKSQQEMANELGVTQKAVSTYEDTEYMIPENIIKLLELKYHINREYLTSGTGEMFTDDPEKLLLEKYTGKYRNILENVFEMNEKKLDILLEFINTINKGL